MVTARCPVCGGPEGTDRCCWPMPQSPEVFWPAFDDVLFDFELEVERAVGHDLLTMADVARVMGWGSGEPAVHKAMQRGNFPLPARRELDVSSTGFSYDRAVWTVAQVARALWWRSRRSIHPSARMKVPA